MLLLLRLVIFLFAMWPGNAFHTSNVTSENHRRAQSNNCPTNEIINPAFASLQQSWQQQAAQASAMPSANTPLSNMHSRFAPSHPGSSLVTHPASVRRETWEYPSPFAARHQTMQGTAFRTCTNNWQAPIQQTGSHSLPFCSSAVTAYPLHQSLLEGQAEENKRDAHNVKMSRGICGGLCNSRLQGIGTDDLRFVGLLSRFDYSHGSFRSKLCDYKVDADDLDSKERCSYCSTLNSNIRKERYPELYKQVENPND